MGFALQKAWLHPRPNRTAVVQVGPILCVSGHGPEHPDLTYMRQNGKVDVDVTIE